MNSKNKSIEHELIDLMPQTDRALHVLEQRAEELAISDESHETVLEEQSYIRFRLGEHELYGLAYQYIKEVILNITPAKVPYTPSYIIGVINYHGNLLSVLSLKHFFRIQSEVETEKAPLIVVSVKGNTIVLMVDAIEGSDSYNPNNLDAPLSSQEAIPSKYIMGLHKGEIAILNLEVILDAQQTLT